MSSDSSITSAEEANSEMVLLTEETQEAPLGDAWTPIASRLDALVFQTISRNPEFFKQAFKFMLCFCGLQASYLTWGYLQELIMTTTFTPVDSDSSGKFPSAIFCVFCNRLLALIVALIAVRVKHGSFCSANVVPVLAFAPCALSNTTSSWSQYASLKYVSFPVQTVFKSSKIIPVMIMGKFLKGTSYPRGQYVEALLITIGVAIFSVASKTSSRESSTQAIGLLLLCMYISFDSFTSQWQDKLYQTYGRSNVDHFQMMLGVNTSAICITTAGLILSGDIPVLMEFLQVNPQVLYYNIVTAVAATCGQICIFYTIKEFGPVVFTIISTTRQMISIVISSIAFGHIIPFSAMMGAALVFSVIFYQIRRKYIAQRHRREYSEGECPNP